MISPDTRDSDIIRSFGNKRSALLRSRIENGQIMTFEKTMEKIMQRKTLDGVAWVVSNCNQTNGAIARNA